MDPEGSETSSGSLEKPEQPPGRPVRSGSLAPRARPVRSARSSRRLGAGADAQPSTTPTAPEHKTSAKDEDEAPQSAEKEEAIQQRAEGRAKVPPKFRDSVKKFFFSPTGGLKVARLGLLIGALACFITAKAHEWYIAVTILEILIVLFFILSYMLTLHHLLTYLDWPLLDLINTCISAVFLSIVAVLAMQEKERRHLFYLGGILCLTAVLMTVIDGILVTKMIRNILKKFLGFSTETKPVPALADSKAPPKTTKPAPSKPPKKASSKAPKRAASKAPKRASSKAPKRAASKAPKRASSKAPKRVSSKAPSQASSKAPKRVSSKAPTQAPSQT
ncbi:uncharacterized protein [Equus asinus]|uniref:uncharacterized protein n=1 Tax=Equus asinus TaxID=9793 RepID=UPI000719FA57|nr:CKLF-like MARVEL transmembrane domain-containing protein 2 isoform X1 [Equus asinus]